MLFDLHVHTDISPCSRLAVADILRNATYRGLDGVCITDHQTMSIRHKIREGRQPDGLMVIFGMEYTTCEGDFLIFGPFENIPGDLSARALLKTVAAAGGAAVAAHPFRANRPVSDWLIQEGLCRTVEAVNGRNSPDENRQVARWRNAYPLSETGGSDAHTLEELGTVVTRFDRPIHSGDDLISALKNGHCQPWQGYRPPLANALPAVSESDALL
ncbi:histidinol-phosphatase [Desulfonema ishimotonii]|uniref:Histidinol-phosphatase n=1 Tax=Desulfonema ishimotonii TaxID=45657 RepID=A0A401G134_9BACT|nr:PHP domain-containing protein [Desulfonema ishimotonii]GBC62948.1 histidinol-phosphatase [Desulfonema ishimotonii]